MCSDEHVHIHACIHSDTLTHTHTHTLSLSHTRLDDLNSVYLTASSHVGCHNRGASVREI